MAKKPGQPKKPLDKTTEEGGAGPGDVVSASALESLRQYRAETPGAVSIEQADANAKAAEKDAAKNAPPLYDGSLPTNTRRHSQE